MLAFRTAAYIFGHSITFNGLEFLWLNYIIFMDFSSMLWTPCSRTINSAKHWWEPSKQEASMTKHNRHLVAKTTAKNSTSVAETVDDLSAVNGFEVQCWWISWSRWQHTTFMSARDGIRHEPNDSSSGRLTDMWYVCLPAARCRTIACC